MPKQVDHQARRERIAEALWRIVGERGLDGVGLREVAAAADVSLGQLQHYFASKDDLLTFTLDHITAASGDRVRDRILASPDPSSPRVVIREALVGMLPVDEPSWTGNLVMIAYFARALYDERLRELAAKGVPALAAFVADQLRVAIVRDQVAPDLDPDREAMLLLSLADGLTTHTLLRVITPERAVALLDHQVDTLFRTKNR